MQIEIFDRFAAELDEVALRAPDATFYHTSAWIESVSRAFPTLKFRCIVAEDAGEVVGYLPFFVISRGPLRAIWSMPFGTYGGPAVTGGGKVLERLVDAFVAMRKQRRVYEIGWVDFQNRAPASVPGREEGTTHLLDLSPGFEKIWSQRFEKSKRRQTRKAQREGLAVVEARSVHEVRRYYQIYRERAKQWGDRLIYPETLFVELFERRERGVRLFLAYRDETLLGGHMNFYFNKNAIAWNGVTTEDSRGQQAATLLYTTCIRHACEHGFSQYNLGGSLGKRSLMDYKESLGGSPYRYQTLRYRSFVGKAVAALRRG